MPVLAISSVCTRWRSLALSSPGLWSKFKVEIASGDVESLPPLDGFMSTLELFLERSGGSPLSLSVDVGRNLVGYTGHIALSAIRRHSERWKTFEYSGNFSLATSFPSLSGLRFPLLERVNLGIWTHSQQKDLDCFERAPRLRALETHFFVRSRIQHMNLTYLDTRCNYGPVDEVLHSCPNLTALRLREARKADFSISGVTMTSDNIQSLTLDVIKGHPDRQSMVEIVLSSFTFPSLHEFALHLRPDLATYDRAWPQDVFRKFLTRSSCSITTFSLKRIELSDVDLIAVLQLLPSLLHLTVHDNVRKPLQSPITPRFSATLHGSGQNELNPLGSPLLPRLRSLSLDFGGTEFDDKAFIAMVTSRWLPDAEYASVIGIDCLRSVVMRFHARKVDEEVYKPLRYLDRMGMRVVVISRESRT